MKHVILQDTVTEADLLFQQPLNFDQLLNSQVPTGANGAGANGGSIADVFQSQFSSMEDHEGFSDSLVDHTLEVPRGNEIDELAGVDDDLELDLDFDLDGNNANNNNNNANNNEHDSTIEAGRGTHEPNFSGMPDTNDLPDLGFDDDYALPDFDEPQVPSPEEEEGPEEPRTPESTSIQEIPFDENDEQSKKQKQHKKPRKPRVFENTNVVRTARKRVIYDDGTESNRI
ncbi:unnamed protein product [Ambrosiozyma monospora]|uniref:Unnamed protein product n=1 Tax=Ambrosiozyma monospora TaxID=43982 RepID=A0ACB5U4E5_AMBMO|nr:unnamed protein product [Ambrosiozyma monospora]